jgi:hypothetical protein
LIFLPVGASAEALAPPEAPESEPESELPQAARPRARIAAALVAPMRRAFMVCLCFLVEGVRAVTM